MDHGGREGKGEMEEHEKGRGMNGQQPWRSLRSLSTSCFLFVSSALFAFIVYLLLGVLSVLGFLQVKGKGRWKGRKGRGMNGQGGRKREGGEGEGNENPGYDFAVQPGQ